MIAVIDYGAGNIQSVVKALKYIGCECAVTSDRAEVMKADAVILPGVGAFGSAMDALKKSGMDIAVRETVAAGKPFLGICLGLQVLFDGSDESPGKNGLSVLRGRINRIPPAPGLKIPHIGWNSVRCNRDCPIFSELPENPYFYFVHSYYLHAEDENIVSARTDYGVDIHAAVWNDNCFATQFHPEKSGEAGLCVLRSFAKLAGEEI